MHCHLKFFSAALLAATFNAAAQSGDPPAKVVILPERAEPVYQQYH